MDTLAWKLVATPLFMVAVTVAGRRFGHGVSGWLTGLPLTSGPVSVFLALDNGGRFAQEAAPASLGGFVAFLAFCGAAAWVAPRAGWMRTILAGLVAFVAVESLVLAVPHPFWPTLAAALAAAALLLAFLWRPTGQVAAATGPRWDLPARAGCATAMVLCITGLAGWAGPDLAGVLSPLPLFASVLVAFTHHQAGGLAARETLRGIAAGAFSFVAFFAVVGLGLAAMGLALTYLLAGGAAMMANAATLALVRPNLTQAGAVETQAQG